MALKASLTRCRCQTAPAAAANGRANAARSSAGRSPSQIAPLPLAGEDGASQPRRIALTLPALRAGSLPLPHAGEGLDRLRAGGRSAARKRERGGHRRWAPRSRLGGSLDWLAEIEILVDLARGEQVFELLQPGEGAVVEDLLGHLDLAEDIAQLGRAAFGRPLAAEVRQVLAYLGEGDAIAAGVAAARAEAQGATREFGCHDLGDLADAVVLLVAADVEDLVMHGLARRLEREADRLADVVDMDQRPPRRAVAGHLHFLGGP